MCSVRQEGKGEDGSPMEGFSTHQPFYTHALHPAVEFALDFLGGCKGNTDLNTQKRKFI